MGSLLGNPGRMLSLCLVASVALQLPAGAQEMPPVYVSSELDDDTSLACQIRKESLIAAAESTLRYNGVTVASRSQYMLDEAINARVDATTIRQTNGFCASYLSLSFQSFQPIYDAVTGKRMWVSTVYCERGAIFGGSSADFQSRLNDSVRDYTSECISEFLSKPQ